MEAGASLSLQLVEEKSVSKASHLLTRVRKFIYSLPPCNSSVGSLMKPWKDNNRALGIKHCCPGNFNHQRTTGFFSPPSDVARQQVRQAPDILYVYACGIFLVGQWAAVAIRVCIEEP